MPSRNELKIEDINNQQNFKVDSEEIAIVLPLKYDTTVEPIKVHIESIMPKVQNKRGLPKKFIRPLNKSIYANDKECMPTVSRTIQYQNYRSLYRLDNRPFCHRYIDHGAKIKVASWNGDHDLMYATNKLDPSYCDSEITDHPTSTSLT